MDSWWDPSALKARMASMIDAINVGQEVAEIAEFSMLLTESLRKAIIEGEQESVLLERAGNFQKDFLDCYPSDQDTQKKSLNRFPECFALLRGLLNFIGEHRLENQIDLQSTLRADLSSVTTSFVRERFQTAFREQVWKKYDGLKFDSLFPGYPPGQSGKQITPDLLIRWVQDLRFALNQPLGRERLFFPVVEIASKVKEVKKTQEKESVDSKAWIVAAEITAFPCKSLIEWKILDRVLLAPWTFFSLDQSTLDSLNEALPPALDAAVDAVRRSMPSPAVTSGDTSDCRILINLQPIGAEEFKSSSTTETGRIKEQNRLFRQFCPPGTMIKGESLGLALSVAAVAAVLSRRVRPLVATGTITNSGEFGDIGGFFEKHQAMSKLKICVRHNPTIVAAAANSNLVASAESKDEYKDINWVAKLSDLFTKDNLGLLLTDGFDDFRKEFAKGSPRFDATTPKANPQPEIEGLSLDDLAAIQKLIEPGEKLMTETGSSSEVGIHWITLPFGEIPEPIAKWVWQRKWVSLRESIQGNESANAIIWADRPVVLPLHLGDLGKYEELTLEAAVDASLRERLNLKSIGIDSCRAKLRSPGQVILVVYDDESRTLFSLDEPAFKRRTELLRQLHELKRTQSIIFIFSDYHHERLWKSLEPVERTKAIQEAAV